jgi:hypothetical protein
MGYAFNPFTGNFDVAGAAASIPDPLTVNNLTVNTLLTAAHIHGNVAGSLYIHVKNTGGTTLAKGTPVYAVGAVGDTTTLEVAAADSANAAKSPAIGVLDQELIQNASGHAVMFGEITGINTGSYAIGDELYLASGGGLTSTKPTSGYVQSLAVVGRVHALTGTILVWAASEVPPTDLAYTSSTRLLSSSTGADVTLPLFATSSSNAGLVPGSSTGGTTNFLRADGSWTPPPVTSPGGTNTQIQFNDSGSFGGDTDLTYNKTTNVLTNRGDINLDDGSSFTTTLQAIAPTANRTINLPDATGIIGLVAGGSGNIVYNLNGAYAGLSTLNADGSGNLTLSGRLTNSYASLASAPAKQFTGTWFTGGTTTTTKPHFLLEPAGTTSTAWSTSGTGLGVNAASGFAGNLLDLQVNGVTRFFVRETQATIVGNLAFGSSFGTITCGETTSLGYSISRNSITVADQTSIAFGTTPGFPDVAIRRDAANTLAQRNGTSAQTFRVYNTFTSATNHERGKLEWSSSVFNIGTERGSDGGTARAMALQTNGTNRLVADTIGSLQVATALTVATLPPSPLVGMIARVTDATAPVAGSTVTGGGSANALCWYNGTNWTVLGV